MVTSNKPVNGIRRMTGVGSRAFIAVVCLVLTGTALAVPKIKTWKTENGAQVLYVRANHLPILDVRVLFRAGSTRDGNKPGLASLTNRMLAMGSGGKTASEIAERFEMVGAKQGSGAARDSAWFSLRTLTDKKLMDVAVNTLGLMISNPNFRKADLERERKRVMIGLKHQEQSPGAIAKRRFFRELYGKHPYGHLPIGTMASVKSIARQDMVRFHKQFYVGNNATVAIVGALSEKQARAIVKRLIGKLPKGKKAPDLPPVKMPAKGKVVRIRHPSTQTHILVGHPGMSRGDRDYYALYVANHAFGGNGLVSRLSNEVREKRGLAYSAYSYFYPMAGRGPFIMGMQTKNAKAGEGLKVMRNTLAKYIAEGISAKEFKASKMNITGGFPLRVDDNRKIVEYLGMIGFYNLPLTYLNDFNSKINGLTRNRVRSAFGKRIKPKQLITVIVGG